MVVLQDGSDGQSSKSGFMQLVEQVLAMQQQQKADLKQLLLAFSRYFQVPTAKYLRAQPTTPRANSGTRRTGNTVSNAPGQS